MTGKNTPFLRPYVHMFLIIILGFLVYSNTFNVPFIFDDGVNIVENPVIKDSQYFKGNAKVYNSTAYKGVKDFFGTRYIGYLSFAINYRLHGLDVFGYHVVNISIHIINAMLVYWLIALSFKTPFFKSNMPESDSEQGNNRKNAGIIALFSSLLFAAHPIQTQAVTYMVQRFTSLATLFYLFSIVLYIKSRLVKSSSNRFGFYVASLLTVVLAMKTKEISFTLPFIIGLYEFLFFAGRLKKRILLLFPIFLALFIIPITLITNDFSGFQEIEDAFNIASYMNKISRWDYLITQFRVIVTYIRLMLFPVMQNLDYDYPVYRSFFNIEIVLSFILLVMLLGFGIYSLRRSSCLNMRNNHILRLSAFGMFWFFITLSVESSIIPIADVIFEHRLYLPSVGFLTAIVAGIIVIKDGLKEKIPNADKLAVYSSICITVLFSSVSYARNIVWQTEIGLWEDTVSKSYGKVRPHYILGLAYSKKDRFDDAMREFLYAVKKADFGSLHYNMGWVYFKKNQFDDAVREYLEAIKRNPDYTDAYINLGVVYIKQGRLDDAIKAFKKAITIKPDDPDAHYNLGGVYEGQGQLGNAIEEYRIVLRQRPRFAEEQNNIGVGLFRQGRFKEAERKYRIAIGLKPDMDQPHYNLGLALKKMGRLDEAVKEFKETIRLNPDMERAYYNLGMIYKEKGLSGKAKESFQTAIKLKPDYQDARKELEALK
ncbi:MAG TPA: hypothetical protein DHV16_08695 [Nitrospiraceae bacterium]|nr:hypothetical protein [Nitrospiraceae bacterium]